MLVGLPHYTSPKIDSVKIGDLKIIAAMENPPFTPNFPSYKPPFGSGISELAMFDDTGGNIPISSPLLMLDFSINPRYDPHRIPV
jgi:hypothetical protein